MVTLMQKMPVSHYFLTKIKAEQAVISVVLSEIFFIDLPISGSYGLNGRTVLLNVHHFTR